MTAVTPSALASLICSCVWVKSSESGRTTNNCPTFWRSVRLSNGSVGWVLAGGVSTGVCDGAGAPQAHSDSASAKSSTSFFMAVPSCSKKILFPIIQGKRIFDNYFFYGSDEYITLSKDKLNDKPPEIVKCVVTRREGVCI